MPPKYTRCGVLEDGVEQALSPRRAKGDGVRQLAPALAQQIIADVGVRNREGRRKLWAACRGNRRVAGIVLGPGQGNRAPGNIGLQNVAATRQFLDRLAITVAAAEVLAGVNTCRILTQHVIDQADLLEEYVPVQCRQHAQAGDAIAHADLVPGLALRFAPEHLIGVGAVTAQVALQPVDTGLAQEIVIAQQVVQVQHEGIARTHIGCHVKERADFLFGQSARRKPVVLFDQVLDLAQKRCGFLAILPGPEDVVCQAAQVLHQGQAEHDGNGPEFADGQRRDGLVGLDEAQDVVLIQAAVGVGDQRQAQGIDAGIASQGPQRQLRQLSIIALGQIVPRLAEGFLDDVKIVEQPFCFGADHLLSAGGLADLLIGLFELLARVIKVAQQRPATVLRRSQDRRLRQDSGNGLEVVGPMEVAADEFFTPRGNEAAKRVFRSRGRRARREGQRSVGHEMYLLEVQQEWSSACQPTADRGWACDFGGT